MFKTSDISLWLHNKLGTSNDSWISGSICSQLNKEVLRNIKDCFPDLQTQVKLKLLLSFFHIPKRVVEEWKSELEEIIEVAGLDSELWVSMIAETMKTFPASGSLNTEITEYEETRPIFTDMVNDLKRLVTKNYDMSMLPLECQYLNKSALVSVVGQQAAPVKHFTLKRKPKSQTLRAELLQKSSDAQSSIKKVSAPTVPLRSRGMPRKMTDTTPMKGIPSRVPTSGFRSPPATQNQQRPSASRTTAGRKDGGIKLLDITEQPLGYAAAKKRKRQQDLEEQAKKAQEAQSAQEAKLLVKSEPNSSVADVGTSSVVTTTPDYAAGLAPSTVYSQPPTPLTVVSSATASTTIKMEIGSNNKNIDNDNDNNNDLMELDTNEAINDNEVSIMNIKMEPPATPQSLNTTNKVTMAEHKLVSSNVPKLTSLSSQTPTLASISSNSGQHSTIKIVKIEQPDSSLPACSAATFNKIVTMTSTAATRPLLTRTTIVPAASQQTTATIGGRTLTFTTSGASSNPQISQSVTPTLTKQPNLQPQEIKQEIKYVTKTIAAPSIQKAGGQTTITQENLQKILSQANLILTKTGTTAQTHSNTSPIKSQQQSLTQFTVQQSPQQAQQQRTLTSISTLPTLTTTISRSQLQQVHQQQLQQQQTQIAKQTTFTQKSQPTKIVQIKTAPTIQNMTSASMQNIPPLIPTNQSYVLGSNSGQRKTLTFTSQNPQTSNIIQTSLGQFQIQQHHNQPIQQQTIQVQPQSAAQSTNQPQQQQQKFAQVMLSPNNVNMKGKTIILANPSILNQKGLILRSVGPSGNTIYQQISGISGDTIIQQQSGGPPSLIKSNDQQSATTIQQLPALIPTNQNIPSLTPVMIQSSSSGGQQQKGLSTLINQHTLPQQTIIRPVQGGQMTLIQRPGQQAQLVQTISQPQGQSQQGPQRIIMTQPQSAIHIQQVPQNPASTIQIQQIQPIVVQQNQLQQQTTQAQGTRKGLSLSNLHILEAHDMFKKANRVTRLEKAIILGFMAGYRDNPRPNPDNVVVIKLNESKENVTQEDDTKVPMLVESLIRLDYNTGEWKTFRKYKKLDQNQQVETPMANATVTS